MISEKHIDLSYCNDSGWAAAEIHLIRAATTLIDEGATWNWSLRDFASAAGMPPNAIFRKFRTRERFMQCLAKAWQYDLRAKTGSLDGVEQLVAHLRWIVHHRERPLFLVAESTNTVGYVEFNENIFRLLPDFSYVGQQVALQHSNVDSIHGDFAASCVEAIRAGLGILMFEKPSLNCDFEENDRIFRRVFMNVWQITTGLAISEFPEVQGSESS
jgi:AcrR family transcriptional regulator